MTAFEERPAVAPRIYRIAPAIDCLYLGRDVTPPSPVADIPGNWVDMDWEWGVCSYVLHAEGQAVVFDTGVYPSQGAWIRSYVENDLGIRKILVVNSHWHLDHTAGNAHFSDCPIVATRLCREELAALQERIETATLWGQPAVKAQLPTITFEDELHVTLGGMSIRFMRFDLHTPDSVLAMVEGAGTPEAEPLCLCTDMLEDTVPFVTDFTKVPTFVAELGRMRALGARRFFPCHGNPQVIGTGGYTEGFIDAVEEYLRSLAHAACHAPEPSQAIEDYVPRALAAGHISIWEPYRSVHRQNIAGMCRLREEGALDLEALAAL